MRKRYSIWVREFDSDHDVELMQVDANPGAITKGLHAKMVTIKKGIFESGKRKSKMPLYSNIYVVDNGLDG
jgi:hypothetical protein